MDETEFVLLYLVQKLVMYPSSVSIENTKDDRGTLLSVTVDPVDMGRLLGKKGNTAMALRHLLHALGARHDERYALRIVDVNPRPLKDVEFHQ